MKKILVAALTLTLFAQPVAASEKSYLQKAVAAGRWILASAVRTTNGTA
jgi:hypothetical protein